MTVAQKYYAYRSFSTMAFVGAIWLLFYRFFMSDFRVGILDMISFALGMLMEIPSGTLGDRFGHKKIAILGCTLAGLGFIMQGAANAYWMILVSQIIMASGWALRSGSDTALVYDAYKAENGTAKNWKKVLNRAGQYAVTVELLAYFSGGYMYVFYKPLPFYAMGVGSIISGLFLLKINEVKENRIADATTYISRMKEGMLYLTHSNLRRFIPVVSVVCGLFYVFSYGLLRPVLQDHYGFGAIRASWLLLGCGLFTLVLQTIAHRYLDRLQEVWVIVASGVILIAGLLMGATTTISLVGVIVIAMLYSFEYIISPWIDDAVNMNASKSHRATTLSAVAFLKSVPYVILAPVIGAMSESGAIAQFLSFYAVAIFIAILAYYHLYRNTSRVPFDISAIHVLK